ncbi:DJ-1/PfpI family protein [Micromonospora maritima]|uniref:DJ-1/PfpI family protein n=1 Tax=Micromonospora maritima TaxID=986711 RepID=UPI0037BD75FC
MSTTFDDSDRTDEQPVPDGRLTAPLDPPATGDITVAFLIAPGTELVDLAGPWGVFEYVHLADGRNPFTLYTVAATTGPVRISGGMVLVPGHDLDSAPPPDVVVVPATDNENLAPEALEWLRRVHQDTAVTMSVCNGSFVLAQAGLLDGRTATAHHGGYAALRATFPDVTVVRGRRYVEDGRIATAGGLTSGIDLALRVVERYFGRDVARQTATELEYQGTGWTRPSSNSQFATRPVSSPGRPLCPVCEMPVSPDTSFAAEYDGVTRYFCGSWCERQFAGAPDRFVGAG